MLSETSGDCVALAEHPASVPTKSNARADKHGLSIFILFRECTPLANIGLPRYQCNLRCLTEPRPQGSATTSAASSAFGVALPGGRGSVFAAFYSAAIAVTGRSLAAGGAPGDEETRSLRL